MTLTQKHLQQITLLKLKNTKQKKKQKKKKTLNNTSLTEHKTDINITKNNKCKKTEQQFYNGAQNRTQIHFREPGNKHTQIN